MWLTFITLCYYYSWSIFCLTGTRNYKMVKEMFEVHYLIKISIDQIWTGLFGFYHGMQLRISWSYKGVMISSYELALKFE